MHTLLETIRKPRVYGPFLAALVFIALGLYYFDVYQNLLMLGFSIFGGAIIHLHREAGWDKLKTAKLVWLLVGIFLGFIFLASLYNVLPNGFPSSAFVNSITYSLLGAVVVNLFTYLGEKEEKHTLKQQKEVLAETENAKPETTKKDKVK